MRKILILALLVVAVSAAPALASVQNIKVSGDIESTFIARDQWHLGNQSISTDYEQNLFITQTRLRIDADLTDNVSTTVALINERAWDQQSNTSDDIDIDLAFVQIREMLYSPLTVTVGRQSFAFGNSFVIDSRGNSITAGALTSIATDLSKRSGMDAIRATLDYNPLVVDIMYIKVDDNNSMGTGAQDDDIDAYGINANWAVGDELNTAVEGYFWAKIDQGMKTIASSAGHAKADTVYMPGIKASSNLFDGFMISAEMAFQYGNKAQTSSSNDNIKRRAMGGQIIANYALPFEKTASWSPVVTTFYNYASGDSGPAEPAKQVGRQGDEYFTGWDPVLEYQGTGTLYNALFSFTNCHVLGLSAQASPMQDVTASLSWTQLWLDKKLNDYPAGSDEGLCMGSDCLSLGQPDGNTSSPTMTSDRKLGDEIGIKVMYDYTEDVKIGGSLGYFFPGSAFYSDNDQNASQILLNTNVLF